MKALVAFAVITGMMAACSGKRSPVASGSGAPAPSAFEIHGHRGAPGHHPENTIEGFEAALAAGADVLETDLLLTSDGVVVINHNFELNPDTTRDATGNWLAQPSAPLVKMTAAELARYDVGRLRPGSEYAAKHPHQQGRDGVRIPTLADALTAIDRASGGKARWNLEIKIATEQPERTAPPETVVDATVALLRERDMEARVMIQSFDFRVTRRVQKVAPSIRTGCLTAPDTIAPRPEGPSPFNGGLDIRTFGDSVPRLVHAAGCRYWTPNFKTLTDHQVLEAHQLGLRVVPWTVNEPDDLRRVIALGVDGVITDYPDRAARPEPAVTTD
ncbi:MAG: glycerophosphodiester phosphodiesterase [Deltaproteobacteria bacterium]|nr:glycerophosphodiester phosphodiesterase [Deltaproteobacteria bacterium]MDQ3295855.1 glycerophosphodiester phosphodiesterase [Myxococcota bacterium]